jgi:glycosyltransferase involved in cell wall biosynthesis
MKICLLNNLYKPYNRGGAEKVVEITAIELRKRGYEVFVITTKPYFSFAKKNQEVSVYYLSSLFYDLNRIPFVLRFFWHFWDTFDFFSYYRIKKILKQERPDLAISHNLKGLSLLVPFLLRSLRIDHIHTLHDVQLLYPSGLMTYKKENAITGPLARIYSYLTALLIASPAVLISPSAWLLQLHKQAGFFIYSKQIVLPNPIPGIDEALTEKIHRDDVFRFLYVGQIETHKGVEILLRAFKDFQKDFPETELLLVGTGSKMTFVEEMAKEFTRIKVLGRLDAGGVKQIMQKADCLVVPSLCYENSPTVIYEAAMVKLPVIASSLGGIAEILKNTKVLFTPNDKDLKEKMIWAYKHQDEMRAMAEENYKRNRDFSPSFYVDNLLKLAIKLK